MVAIGSRESVIQNLEDAGCEIGMIRDFLGCFDKGQQEATGTAGTSERISAWQGTHG